MADTRFRVRPTFPLDKQLIQRYRWKNWLRSPLTWGTLAVALGAAVVARIPLPGMAVLLGTAIGGLTAYWKSQTAKLDAEAVSAIIKASNEQQDIELQRIMDELRADGHHQYSVCLGKFLLLKQHIEEYLHEDGALTKRKQQIEVLVDGMCHAICDQLTRLTRLHNQLSSVLTSGNPEKLAQLRNEIDDSHKLVMDGYSAIYSTAENLGAMLQPGVTTTSREEQESQVMDRLIEQLQEETEVAKRVHERLKDVI
jgi:hypothetical protein